MRRRSLICLGTAVLLLGACSASSNVTVSPAPAGSAGTEPGSTGATPSPDPPAAVDWQDCPTSKDYDSTAWQCGTIEVPLRYDQPSAGTIKLALTRHPATDDKTRIGSLFVNPGGPGASGINSVHFLVDELPEDVRARFDLVGFDPRGVGQSTPVDCMGDQAKDAEADLDPMPDTPAEITALTDRVEATAAACAKAQGELLPYVGTANAARDLDRLREAVGDEQITYLGYSYGTMLGAIYADLFPDKVRAMVLDGVLDPTTGVDPSGEQHSGTYGDQDFAEAFVRFAAACGAVTACTAGPDAKGLLDQVRAQVEAAPLPAPTVEAEDGRKLTTGLFESGVFYALYDTSTWPFLSVGLRDAANGDGSILIRLADLLNGRKSDGTWDNTFDAFRAISCADFSARPSAADANASYTAVMGTGEEVPANMPNPACQGWAPTADPLPVVTKAATEHPVLVLGTKGDPATPYANAAAMASSLGNAVELTWEGDGHTAFPKTKCINDAVGRYLTDVIAPPAGTDCPAADGGGTSTAGSAYALDRDLLRRQIEDGFKQNGTPTDLATCIARPLAEDLDENQLVHFFLGLDAAGLNDKLNAVASSCGGTFGSSASGSGTGGG